MQGKKEISKLIPIKIVDKRGKTTTVWKKPGEVKGTSLIKRLESAIAKLGNWRLTEVSKGNRYTVERVEHRTRNREYTTKLVLEGSKKNGRWRVWKNKVWYSIGPDGKRDPFAAIVTYKSRIITDGDTDWEDASETFIEALHVV